MHVIVQVGKLKQKVSEKRKRHSSATLKSLSLNKLSSHKNIESKGYQQSKVVITMEHWRHAMRQVRPSLSEQEKAKYRQM